MFTKRERLHWITRLSLLCAIAILSTCQDSAREVFRHARNFYLSGEYGGAAKAMESFVHAHPGHELGSRALLIQGKAEIGRPRFRNPDRTRWVLVGPTTIIILTDPAVSVFPDWSVFLSS